LAGAAFLATAFLAGAAFLATAFLAGAFLATAFFAGAAFLAGVFFAAGLALFLLGTRGTLCPISAKCHSRHRGLLKVGKSKAKLGKFLVAGLCLE
jgi:predicted phage tail protein